MDRVRGRVLGDSDILLYWDTLVTSIKTFIAEKAL